MKTALIVSTLFLLLFTAPLAAGDLRAPGSGKINVAFVLTDGATMIDFAGPWEVFQDVHVPSRGSSMDEQMPFELYTVSETLDPIHTSGGMKVIPDFTFDDAPMPDVVVVGAQRGSAGLPAWLRKVAPEVDVLMSVCTGAFKLADAGLLKGKRATTHHDFFDRFEERFPDVELVRGRRFVEADDVIASAGGLTSGIDLALHVVSRYFGEDIAERTARYMEYESDGWKRGDLAEPAKRAVK